MTLSIKTALLPLSLVLMTTALAPVAHADKYNDQKSVRELQAVQADEQSRTLAAERAEIKNNVGMSCDQIADEVVRLDRTIRAARLSQSESRNAGTGVSVAKTVGSLLVGSLGGVVGIVAVGALAGEAVEVRAEKAALVEEKSEERQNRLAGIFDGKGCEGALALTGDSGPSSDDDIPRIEPAAGAAPALKPRYNQ